MLNLSGLHMIDLEEIKKENEELKRLLIHIKDDLIVRVKLKEIENDGNSLVVDLSASLYDELCELTKNVSKSK